MIADLKPYLEYKESGLPWLGQVPKHWDTRPAFGAFVPNQERNHHMKEKTVLSLSYGRIIIKPAEKLHGLVPESFETYQIVNPGDIVLRTTDLQNDHTSPRVGMVRNRGIITSAYLALRVNAGVSPDFGFQYLSVWDTSKAIYGYGSGLRQNLDFSHFKRMPVVVPPPAEQTAIVRFLDWANGRLERAIRAKRQVIALLNEQKQAIIASLVTGKCEVRRVTGEDGQEISHFTPRPSHLMKPSGIPWLGDSPKHWEVRRLKSLVKDAVAGPYGSSLTKSMYTQVGYRVYGQQQVIPDDFTIGDYYISKEQFDEMQRYKVFAGDVLVSVMGTVGRVAVVPDSAEPGIINPRLVRYRPDLTVVRPRWLQLVMQDGVAQAQLSEASKGTTMDGLNMQILGKLLLLKPPLAEQDTILGYVSKERQPFSNAISRLSREIALLREYRTRLIADVVTGKLDVREAAARLPDEAVADISEDDTELSDDSDPTDEEAED
jgi:type I restriction enzyme, S subunit